MPNIESFIVVYRALISSHDVIFTKNCTKRRANRLWKKFLKKHHNYPSGTYVIAYVNRTFTALPFADAIKESINN